MANNENNARSSFGSEINPNNKRVLNQYIPLVNKFKDKINKLNSKYLEEETKIETYQNEYFQIKKDWNDYKSQPLVEISVEAYNTRATALISNVEESRDGFIKLLIEIDPSISLDEFNEKLDKRYNNSIRANSSPNSQKSKTSTQFTEYKRQLIGNYGNKPNNEIISNSTNFYNIYEQLKQLRPRMEAINRFTINRFKRGIELPNNTKKQYLDYLNEVSTRIACIYNYIARTIKIINQINFLKENELSETKLKGAQSLRLIGNIGPIQSSYNNIIESLSIQSLDNNIAALNALLPLALTLGGKIRTMTVPGTPSSGIEELIASIRTTIQNLEAIKIKKSSKNTGFRGMISIIEDCLGKAAAKIQEVRLKFTEYKSNLNKNKRLPNNKFNPNKAKFDEISRLILELQGQITSAIENNGTTQANVNRVNYIMSYAVSEINKNKNAKGKLNNMFAPPNRKAIQKKLFNIKLTNMKHPNSDRLENAKKINKYFELMPSTPPSPPRNPLNLGNGLGDY